MMFPSSGQALAELDSLLASRLQQTVPNLLRHESTVAECLRQNKERFDATLATLKSDTNNNSATSIEAAVLEIENTLQKNLQVQKLTNRSELDEVVLELFTFLGTSKNTGLYLTEEAACHLLKVHPPVYLAKLSPSFQDGRSSRELLSITRHTETKSWQDIYLKHLKCLGGSNYAISPVNFTVIDTQELCSIMSASDMKQKPWRMSHTKELGIINIFTHDATNLESGTPLLQFLLVLFHYYFETLFAGEYLKIYLNEGNLGTRLNGIIRSGDDKFEFFHPNCYTEYMYWKEAMKAFSKYASTIPQASIFADTLSCGYYSGNEGILSLNLIDRVWNLNLQDSSTNESYFETSIDPFLYHFREGLWYDLLSTLAGLNEDSMATYLKQNLHKGDKTITRELFSKLV